MTIDLKRRLLREQLIARRNALGELDRQLKSARLVTQLETVLAHRFGRLDTLDVGAYLPIGSEPDITKLFARFKSVALPQVVSRDAPLRFLHYRPGMALQQDAFGVRVPVEQIAASPSILLVPCVGFHMRSDGRLDRLGYGGGFYDRTLAAETFATIGVAFAVSAVETFASQQHDVPLDAVVTEDGQIGDLIGPG